MTYVVAVIEPQPQIRSRVEAMIEQRGGTVWNETSAPPDVAVVLVDGPAAWRPTVDEWTQQAGPPLVATCLSEDSMLRWMDLRADCETLLRPFGGDDLWRAIGATCERRASQAPAVATEDPALEAESDYELIDDATEVVSDADVTEVTLAHASQTADSIKEVPTEAAPEEVGESVPQADLSVWEQRKVASNDLALLQSASWLPLWGSTIDPDSGEGLLVLRDGIPAGVAWVNRIYVAPHSGGFLSVAASNTAAATMVDATLETFFASLKAQGLQFLVHAELSTDAAKALASSGMRSFQV